MTTFYGHSAAEIAAAGQEIIDENGGASLTALAYNLDPLGDALAFHVGMAAIHHGDLDTETLSVL